MRYLALGDSYTIGERVAEAQRWPVQLAQRLMAAGIPAIDLTMVAQTGWTTAELQDAVNSADIKDEFDLVSLLIGVNNQYRGLDQDEYRAEFTELLAQAVAYAGDRPERVLVLSIPDWGVTPFAGDRDRSKISAEIDAFNLINLEQAQQMSVCYVDVTPSSRLAELDASLLAEDGLHPSGKMYAEWVNLILPAAALMLAEA